MYTVVAQREIPLPVAGVWDFLTQPELLARWFADTSRLAPDEPFRFDFGDGDFHAGRVVEWEPNIVLGVRWTVLGLGPEYHVLFSLLRRKGGTELSVQDRGALSVEEAECLRVGWSEFLMRLEKAVRQDTNARFNWREMITFTACVNGQRTALAAALTDPSWYRRAFSGARAEILKAGDREFAAILTKQAWAGATTDLRMKLERVRGHHYLSVIHQGWGELPAAVAAEERRRFVELWRQALLELALS